MYTLAARGFEASYGGAPVRQSEENSLASKIFVGNLEFSTTREEIAALFAEAGQVQDVFLPLDRATARPRGFAFVEFGTAEEAAQAIERFNGHELGGRPLRVNAAEDRPRRSFGGGGGSGDRPSFGGGGNRFGGGKPKGSRRNARAKKRSL